MLKSRIGYGICILVTTLTILLFGEGFAFTMLYTLLIFPILSLLLLCLSPYFIKVKETREKTDVFKNEPLYYRLSVTKKGFFAFLDCKIFFHGINLVNYGQTSQSGQKTKSEIYEYLISFPYRGKYNVGVESFCVYDFLGLFRFKFARKKPVLVTVFPERIENFTMNLSAAPLSKHASAFEISKDNTEISDVRKYNPSDEYKKIHWKLTAKRNEFMVKNYPSSILSKAYIFLDTKKIAHAERLKFEDKLVSYAVSAAYYCVKERTNACVSCGTSPADNIDVYGFDGFNALNGALAETAFTENDYLSTLLKNFPWGDGLFNIIIFTAALNDEMFSVISELSSDGHNMILYYMNCQAVNADEKFLSVLTENGVAVIWI